MTNDTTPREVGSHEGLGPLYPERDHMAQGEHYLRHVDAMTREGLHAKSRIAGELAARDIEIERAWAARDAAVADLEAHAAAEVRRAVAAERHRISALMEAHTGIRLATVEYLEAMRQGPTPQEWAALDAEPRA